MPYLILLVLTALSSINAKIYDNPILADKLYYDPGGIKVNETYYIVAKTPDISKGLFPVHSSTDLINWKEEGYVFNEANIPIWARNTTLQGPSIHQMGPNFLLYFDAYNTTDPYYHIGVAVASHPLGPYLAIDRPIMSERRNHTQHTSVINDNENLYLVWSTGYTISARQISANGISFSSDQTTKLLTPTLQWEGSLLYYPWYVRKGKYHYLFYTGGDYCDNGIGVARSTNALGPYEKLPDPILVSNSTYSCTRDSLILKDLDNKKDVIFLNSKLGDYYRVVMATLGWDSDHWPFVGEL